MKKIALIHGPNLNLLGQREPEIYGSQTQAELVDQTKLYANKHGFTVDFFQSNHEGELIDLIHTLSPETHVAVIINPAAYTHYSYAIRDAIAAIDLPFVEVHLTDTSTREKFRRYSVVKEVCVASFMGGGVESYYRAIDHLAGVD